MPFKDHLQQRTRSTVEKMDSTVATRPAARMRSYNTSLPIVLARVYNLLSPLPPNLKRKRAVSNLRLYIAKHHAQTRGIPAPVAVSDAQGPSPRQLLTTPANIGRRGPYPAEGPDPLRCHPPFPARKTRKSRSHKRRGTVFTREEKALLEQALPAITEEVDDGHGRKAIDISIYELEAPSQASLSNDLIYELEATMSRDSLSGGSVYELEAPTSRDSRSSGSVYELEATTSQDDSSEVSLPSVVVSDFEPIIASNHRLIEENRHMSAFIQEIVTKDIIINEQLARVTSEHKASEAALNLLWKLVRTSFDGSENVTTPSQIVQFLSTRELLDIPRHVNINNKA